MEKSIDFIISNPKTFLVLTRYRIQAFLVGWSSRHTLVTLLAFVGALMAWRNLKVYILLIFVAAYIFPFSIVSSLMYRYRYPIEPILFALSCGIPIISLSAINVLIGKIKSPIMSKTTSDQNNNNQKGHNDD
jgi:hypothetical protein